MMRNNLFTFILLALLIPFTIQYNAQNDYLAENWRYIGLYSTMGENILESIDFNNDGSEEIILDFNHGGFLTIMKYKYENYEYKWISEYFEDPIVDINIIDINGDSVLDFFILHRSGSIDLFDGKTLTKISSFEFGIEWPNSLNIADIDNDNINEFIIGKYGASQLFISIFNGANYEIEWDTTVTVGYNFEIEIGEVDSDGVMEIILSSGLVIDGQSHKIDWNYVNGFGKPFKVDDLNNDGKSEIVGISNYTTIDVFDAEIKAALWSLNTNHEIESISIYKELSSGKAEIILGDGQWGTIKSYDPLSRELNWNIQNPNHGTTNVAVGDPDNDGEKEVIWGAGISTSASDHLYIASINRRYIEWISKDHIAPFKIDILYNDTAKEHEIIIGCNKSNIFENRATIFTLDSETYQTKLYKSYAESDPKTLLVAKSNENGQSKIITTTNSKMYVFNSETFLSEWSGIINNSNSTFISSAYDDIDNDGIQEIVLGNEGGYVFVLNGETYVEEWHSVKTNGPVKKIMIANLDEDEAKEIIYLNYASEIEIYDGKTHFLEAQLKSLEDINNFDIEDINSDGKIDIICNDSKGKLYILNNENLEVVETFNLNVPGMTGLKIANLDSDPSMEIITGSSKLQIFNYEDLTLKFESVVLGRNVGINNNFVVVDVDKDDYLDIFFNNEYGLYHFECSQQLPDLISPIIFSTYPIDSAKKVGLNEFIDISFSEDINTQTLIDSNITIIINDSLELSKTIEYNSDLKTATIYPDEIFPPNSIVKVVCSAYITDYSMNGLDGNMNGISEGSPIDNFNFSFETAASIDKIAPTIKNLTADNLKLWPGFDIHLSGEISDVSDISTSKIGFVECFIDSIGRDSSGIKLKPLDGLFNSPEENFYFDLITNGWQSGKHKIYLFGYDALGNKSDTSEVSLIIRSEDVKKSNWPMLDQNAQNTRFNAEDSITVPLKLKWSKKLFDNPINQPIVVDNQVFLTENSLYYKFSKLFSLNTENGDNLWTYDIEYSIYVKTVAYRNGRLYLPIVTNPSGGLLLCIDALNGKYLWERQQSTSISDFAKSSIIIDDKVFMAGEYGNLMVMDALKGDSVYWTSGDNRHQYDWIPGLFDDKVYTCGWETSYRSYSIKSGEVEQELGSYPTGYTPVLSNGFIFIPYPIVAVDLISNEVKWTTPGIMQPAIAYNMVFVVNNTILYVHDIETGQLRWSFNTNEEITNSPIISNGFVFLSTANRIIALDIKSKIKTWEYNFGGKITVANDNLFLATDDGRILCFEVDKTTSIVQNRDLPNKFSLNQNYPNPFNPTTKIKYSIPNYGKVKIYVYDNLGRQIQILVDEYKEIGNYEIEFVANNLSNGIYFYRIICDGYSETKKMVLLK